MVLGVNVAGQVLSKLFEEPLLVLDFLAQFGARGAGPDIESLLSEQSTEVSIRGGGSRRVATATSCFDLLGVVPSDQASASRRRLPIRFANFLAGTFTFARLICDDAIPIDQ